MRTINKIIIHSSATPAGRVVTVADITKWHKERGYRTIGYHYVIGLNGEVWEGRAIEEAGAHTLNHNADSIGICYIGGVDKDMKATDTRTAKQRQAMLDLVRRLKQQYPSAVVAGHRNYNSTECPSFDVRAWAKEMQL